MIVEPRANRHHFANRTRHVLSGLIALGILLGPASAGSLPQEHAYQRTLREYLTTLNAADFALEVKKFEPPAGDLSNAQKYREWVTIFAYGWPYLGIIVAPGSAFTLSEVEADEQVLTPASRAETAAWILNWNVPGNPYAGSV